MATQTDERRDQKNGNKGKSEEVKKTLESNVSSFRIVAIPSQVPALSPQVGTRWLIKIDVYSIVRDAINTGVCAVVEYYDSYDRKYGTVEVDKLLGGELFLPTSRWRRTINLSIRTVVFDNVTMNVDKDIVVALEGIRHEHLSHQAIPSDEVTVAGAFREGLFTNVSRSFKALFVVVAAFLLVILEFKVLWLTGGILLILVADWIILRCKVPDMLRDRLMGILVCLEAIGLSAYFLTWPLREAKIPPWWYLWPWPVGLVVLGLVLIFSAQAKLIAFKLGKSLHHTLWWHQDNEPPTCWFIIGLFSLGMLGVFALARWATNELPTGTVYIPKEDSWMWLRLAVISSVFWVISVIFTRFDDIRDNISLRIQPVSKVTAGTSGEEEEAKPMLSVTPPLVQVGGEKRGFIYWLLHLASNFVADFLVDKVGTQTIKNYFRI